VYRGVVESLIVMLLAGIGVVDGWRLSNVVREGGMFHDVIGPDRYLTAISFGLMIMGIRHLVLSLRTKGRIHAKEEEKEGGQMRLVCVVALALMLYTLVLPLTGYLLASLLFFPTIFFIFGVRPWLRSAAIGLITAALFYAIFEYFAEVPLPKGLLEILF
jgi:small-conductance mechanosensitive channel